MTTPEQLETRMLRDRAAIRDEQLAQAQENALLLYQALAKHAPDALAEIKPRLHANIREMDKVVCEVTAAREEAARLRAAIQELDMLLRDFQAVYDDDEIPQLLERGARAALVVERVL